MAVLYDIKVESGASQWYGVISVTNIRYADGSAVRVNDFLGMGFHSPASVQPTDFNPQFWMWTPTTAETTNDQIDSQTWDVTAKLIFELGHTFAAQDKINIGINGDLTGPGAADYLSSFALAADTLPDTNGIVSVQANSAPDERLYSSAQTLYFTQGTQVHVETVAPGTTTPLALPAGTYSITASPLSNHAGTVVSTAHVQPSTVTVTPGSNAVIMVVYDPAKYTAALDVSIGDIPVLADELLDVTVIARNSIDTLAAFSSPPGHLTQLRGLPLVGVVDISVASIAVNNVRHTFPSQHRSLDTKLEFVAFTAADMQSTVVNTTGFVTLPVVITSDVTVNAPLDVRLVAPNMSYHQTFHLVAGTHSYNLAVPVQPQAYTVEVSDFIYDGVVYNTQTADYLVVLSTGKAQLHIDVSQGANLKVRGFPDFLSFGGCADLTPGNAVDFVAARASSVFKYAGFDGAGDPGQYLTDDAQTTRTILLARDVEQQIGGGHQVLPVMVSYTCNLSLGDTPTQLANTQGLAHSFGNLILSLNLAKEHTDVDHPVPCGFVVNPDFLGACQQGGFAPDYAMPVREPLRQALAHWKVVATIPQNIEENIRGYVAAVNWLIRTVAPAVTFGWQVNLWGVGASEWIYSSDDSPKRNARVTAAYVRALKVHEGAYAPDFLAVDRYEADDFTIRAYANGYCYWVHEWKRFFDFCAELSRDLKVPIMPWQVPASHAPLVTDPVNDDFDTQNWGTGGTYILGDPAIGTDYHNINPKIIALQFPDAFHWAMGTSAKDMFERSVPFDVSAPAYGDFPYRGIFTLLLGGGATTGIISTVGDDTSFVRDKLNAYMDHPIPFGNDPASLGSPRPQRRVRRRRGLVRCGR